MATTQKTAQLPFGAITAHKVTSTLYRAFEAVENWFETRRTVTELRRLSPEQLEDIGLTQADIDHLAAKVRF